MDSINTLKGYGKVGQVEDQTPHKKPPNRKILLLLIPTTILATLIFCLAATAIIHNTTTKSNLTHNSDSIKAVCNITNYPQSCISSLQNSTTADPEELLEVSLQATLRELTHLSSLPHQCILKVNDARVKSALLDCESLFSDAVDGVNSSVSVMQVGPGEKMLSVAKINDIKTWLSGAMTNLETCLDGLDEMNSIVRQLMDKKMRNAKEFTSNSLAIAAKIELLLDELHIPMH